MIDTKTRRNETSMPMQNTWRGVWLSLVFLVFFPLGLSAEDIIFYQLDFPPVYIQDGPFKHMGYQNIVDDLIKDALEKNGHRVIYKNANIARTLHDLNQGLHVGSGSMLKSPDRESYMYLTEPHSISLSGMLIIRKAEMDVFKPFMDKSGAISLSHLIQSNTKVIGICKDRPYSAAIDDILKTYASQKNTHERGGSDMVKGLVTMLLMERIDCAILFPWEAFYIAGQLGRDKDMMSIPIQEMAPYVLIYAAFPRNEWGKRMVDQINPVIREFRNTQTFHKTKERWLDEASVIKYRQYVRDYYGQ